MEAELVALKRQLAKVTDGSFVTDEKKAADLLRELDRFAMTKKLLLSTDLGKVVGQLRKAPSSSLSAQAKALVVKWKEQCNVVDSLSSSSSTSLAKAQPDTPTRVATPVSKPSPSPSAVTRAPSNGAASTDVENQVMKLVGLMDNDSRDKCLRFLVGALLVNFDTSVGLKVVADVAREIEEEVLNMQQREANEEYRGKIRQLVFNLRDTSNPRLRSRVLSREVSAERLCRMSHKELASDEQKEEIDKLEKAILHDVVEAKPVGQETDQFKCGKCGQRRTRYTQAQTRSADEPMTTFVTCVVCNNKWKFC